MKRMDLKGLGLKKLGLKGVAALAALLLACAPCAALGEGGLTDAPENGGAADAASIVAADADTIVTVVPAPEQTKAERPPCFPDPSAQFIPLPEIENLAQGKPVVSGAHTDVYVVANVNDGKTDTYWESKGFPAEITIDLQGIHPVSTVAVCLNPSSIWEPRKQEIAVWVSADGDAFAEVAPKAIHEFDPATGNRVRIDFAAVNAASVRLVFTMNSSSRTGGAQAAEICVY